MSPKKATFVLVGVLVLVVAAAAGAFYLGDKMLQKRSSEISVQKAELEAIGTELGIYEAGKATVAKYGFVNELADKILPESKYQSEVVAELTQFATANNMQIKTLTFEGSNANSTDPNLSQTEVIPGLSGIRVLKASIQFQADDELQQPSYSNFLGLLRSIESNQRKVQVTNLTILPNAVNSDKLSSVTINVSIFLKDTAPVVEKSKRQ